MGDNGKIWADGQDPFADLKRTLRRRLFIAMKHGEDTPAFFEEVRKEGLSLDGDEEKIRKLEDASHGSRTSDQIPVTTHVGSDGAGGIQATISVDVRAQKERGINAAIASLGDRTGDDIEDISRDLKKALRARDLGLDQDVLDNISALLADGEEVQIGIDPQ